jgi:Mg2+-importing ATPase
VFHTPQETFQTAWFVVSVLTELAVVLVLRTRLPSWQSNPSRLLFLSTIAVGIIALSLPYLGPLSHAFGFVPLPPTLVIVMVTIVVGYVVATEAAKPFFFARIAPQPPTAAIGRASGRPLPDKGGTGSAQN